MKRNFSKTMKGPELQKRVAVVTGAGRGIGLEVVRQLAERGMNVVLTSPNKNDLGGPEAPQSVEQGAETIVWLATRPDGGPTGGFFRDMKRIKW